MNMSEVVRDYSHEYEAAAIGINFVKGLNPDAFSDVYITGGPSFKSIFTPNGESVTKEIQVNLEQKHDQRSDGTCILFSQDVQKSIAKGWTTIDNAPSILEASNAEIIITLGAIEEAGHALFQHNYGLPPDNKDYWDLKQYDAKPEELFSLLLQLKYLKTLSLEDSEISTRKITQRILESAHFVQPDEKLARLIETYIGTVGNDTLSNEEKFILAIVKNEPFFRSTNEDITKEKLDLLSNINPAGFTWGSKIMGSPEWTLDNSVSSYKNGHFAFSFGSEKNGAKYMTLTGGYFGYRIDFLNNGQTEIVETQNNHLSTTDQERYYNKIAPVIVPFVDKIIEQIPVINMLQQNHYSISINGHSQALAEPFPEECIQLIENLPKGEQFEKEKGNIFPSKNKITILGNGILYHRPAA